MPQGRAQDEICLGIVGVDLNRFAQRLNRSLRVIPGDLRSFQTEQCFFITRIGFRCGGKLGFSFLQWELFNSI